jgi:3-oxoacyl-[acyl-carrier protein] reductase
MTRFSGRVAIVTGASQDPSIGFATAHRLGSEGAAVVINARGEAALDDAVARLAASGVSVVAVAGSADDDTVAPRLVQAAVDEFGQLDFVVNTVGGSLGRSTPQTVDRAELRGTIELNTWNAVALIQAALAGGLAEGGGAVVNVSSGTVNKTTPSMVAYAAAKAALNAITRTTARDLAPLGVRVNAVAPGLTRTTGTRDLWGSDDGAEVAASLPLGKLPTDLDIANACVFLLSDEAASITGQIIDVDAGNHLLGGGWTPMGEPPGASS